MGMSRFPWTGDLIHRCSLLVFSFMMGRLWSCWCARGAWTVLGGLQPSCGLLGGKSHSCLYSLPYLGIDRGLSYGKLADPGVRQCYSVFSFGICQPMVAIFSMAVFGAGGEPLPPTFFPLWRHRSSSLSHLGEARLDSNSIYPDPHLEVLVVNKSWVLFLQIFVSSILKLRALFSPSFLVSTESCSHRSLRCSFLVLGLLSCGDCPSWALMLRTSWGQLDQSSHCFSQLLPTGNHYWFLLLVARMSTCQGLQILARFSRNTCSILIASVLGVIVCPVMSSVNVAWWGWNSSEQWPEYFTVDYLTWHLKLSKAVCLRM